MRKKVVYFLFFLLVAILQLSFIPVISNSGTSADLVLMVILAWSVIDGYFAFFNWALFFGIFYDLISYSPVGTHALIFLAIVYFVSFFSRRLSFEFKGVGWMIFLVFIFFATLVSNFIKASILALETGSFDGYWNFFGSFSQASLLLIFNALLFFACFVLIRKIKRFYLIH